MSDPAGSDLAQMARDFGLDYLEAVRPGMLDPSLVRTLPVDWARTHMILPIRHDGQVMALTADPGDVAAQEYLAVVLGDDVLPIVAPPEEVRKAIETCYFNRDESTEELLDDIAAPEAAVSTSSRSADLLSDQSDTPVTQLVNRVLLDAVKAEASDIHLEPFEDRLRVRFRVDGVLYDHTSPPKHLHAQLVSRLKVMGRMDIAERRLPQDGVARVRVGDGGIDVRVSAVPVAEGERIVLRLLNRVSALLPLEDLGMSDLTLDSFRAATRQTTGVVLVTGPTGSGKTTSLYAALGELDGQRRNIMTIEDPIEYQIGGIGQIQVAPKIGLDFASGLRHILRQDPDVILVGETRDRETADISLRASLTGHLVLTTLHTNDAASAVVRLIDIGIEPYLIAASLRGALAQRLVRKLCPECRRSQSMSERDLNAYGPVLTPLRDRVVWQANGCGHCREGYRGRIGLFQFLSPSDDLCTCIRESGADLRQLESVARRSGMRSIVDDGISKILTGLTTVSEVMQVAGQAR